MLREIKISTWNDGYEWCMSNGFEFLGIDALDNGELVMSFDDGKLPPMSKAEEAYYERVAKQQEKELKKEIESKQIWVIASDDGYCSRMYKGKGRGQYTFNLCDAETYSKSEAQKKAAMMTRNTKVGRVWFGLQIK